MALRVGALGYTGGVNPDRPASPGSPVPPVSSRTLPHRLEPASSAGLSPRLTRRDLLVLATTTLGGLALSACTGSATSGGVSTAVPTGAPPAATSAQAVPANTSVPSVTSVPPAPTATSAPPSPTAIPPTATIAASPTAAPPSATPTLAPTPTLVPTATPAALSAPTAAATLRSAPVVAATPTSEPDVPGAAGGYPGAELLAEVDWLAERLGTLKLIELSDADEFARGHLAGALNVQWRELTLTDSAEATIDTWRAAMEAKLGSLGIRPTDEVVLYDDGSLWAARVWWVLGQLGQHTTRVLHGGKPAWEAAGHSLEPGFVGPIATTYRGTPDPSSLITANELRDLLGSSDLALVDARTPQEFSGQDNSGARRPGHIPGAVNIPYTTTALPEQPRFFLPPAELLALYADRGIVPEKQVVAYCSTGVRSAVTYFTLRLLGYPRVRLYSASYAEWGNRADLPIEV